MSKAAKIKELKKQRKEANEQLDFNLAARLDAEIKNLLITTYRPDFSEVIKIQRQKDRIKLKSVNESSKLEEKTKDLILQYTELFENLKKKQDKERRALQKEKKQMLKRERDRPIPQARERIKKAILIGKTGDFKLAEQIKQDAIWIIQQELPIRLEACRQTYRNFEEKLNRKHARENVSLLQKMHNDFQMITLKSLKKQNQFHASMRNKDIKEQEFFWKATNGFRYVPINA